MGRDHRILVEAAPVGWRVSLDDLPPLMFLSGAKAEQYARDLAARLTQLCGDTEVTIRTADERGGECGEIVAPPGFQSLTITQA